MTDALTRGLERLEQFVTKAEAEFALARAAADRAVQGAIDHVDVVGLRDYCDDIFFRRHRDGKPVVDDAERRRTLTTLLCRAIVEDQLDLVPLGGSRFRIDDAAPQRRLNASREALREATRCRDEFLDEHAPEFEKRRQQAERDVLRDALAAGDPEAVRSALGVGREETAALTSAEL
jgi:hypothetical protein